MPMLVPIFLNKRNVVLKCFMNFCCDTFPRLYTITYLTWCMVYVWLRSLEVEMLTALMLMKTKEEQVRVTTRQWQLLSNLPTEGNIYRIYHGRWHVCWFTDLGSSKYVIKHFTILKVSSDNINQTNESHRVECLSHHYFLFTLEWASFISLLQCHFSKTTFSKRF